MRWICFFLMVLSDVREYYIGITERVDGNRIRHPGWHRAWPQHLVQDLTTCANQRCLVRDSPGALDRCIRGRCGARRANRMARTDCACARDGCVGNDNAHATFLGNIALNWRIIFRLPDLRPSLGPPFPDRPINLCQRLN